MLATRGQRSAVAAFLVLAGVFYLATLRPGQGWGDDFAMYILQARNIASGHWNAPTGYIYNPHVVKGPPAYPPLFPVLLAPLYRIWGLNLTPMKIEVVLLFFAALFLVFEFCSRQVGFRYAAAIVAVLALSPYFWGFKENIVSDLPFLFFLMLAMLAIDSGGLAAAVAVYLCFAMRTAGIALVPCLAWAARSRSRRAWGALAGAILLIGVHSLVFRGAGGYLDYLSAPWRALPRQMIAYDWTLRNKFFGIASPVLGIPLLAVLLALSAAGLVARLKKRVSTADVFVFSYGCMVAVWTADEDVRFLIPLLPFWLLYVAEGLRTLPRRAERAAGIALAAVILVGFASAYARVDMYPLRGAWNNPPFDRVAEYIRAETPRDAVFVFAKPRALTLVTDRSAAAYHMPAADQELWSFFASIGARYALVNRELPEDREYLEPLLLRSARAVEARAEGPLHLYAIR